MCDCELVMTEMYHEQIVRARRPHKCRECWQQILPGESYKRITGKWEGDFDSFAVCLGCFVIWQSVTLEGSCICFGGLREEIREIASYDRPLIDDE